MRGFFQRPVRDVTHEPAAVGGAGQRRTDYADPVVEQG
jgi:hypothetical protein